MLASASPARLSTLRNAGVDPLVVVSQVDEDAALAAATRQAADAGTGPLSSAEQVALLARVKAQEVACGTARQAGEFVLGCDSMLELDGQMFGKPGTAAVARQRWQSMRGRSGTLHTGHFLIEVATGAAVERVVSTLVHFADISDAEIDAYVATGEPLQVAGAFTMDAYGAALVTGIEGDYHNVIGVSVAALRALTAELGHPWSGFWR